MSRPVESQTEPDNELIERFQPVTDFQSSLLFMFDWDNTFFLKNILGYPASLEILDSNQRKQLKELDITVASLLYKCKKQGEVLIVSNNVRASLNHSCFVLMPEVGKLINQ